MGLCFRHISTSLPELCSLTSSFIECAPWNSQGALLFLSECFEQRFCSVAAQRLPRIAVSGHVLNGARCFKCTCTREPSYITPSQRLDLHNTSYTTLLPASHVLFTCARRSFPACVWGYAVGGLCHHNAQNVKRSMRCLLRPVLHVCHAYQFPCTPLLFPG